jgi:protein-S-isoprenylcysteine O-methyltransferase Ste14
VEDLGDPSDHDSSGLKAAFHAWATAQRQAQQVLIWILAILAKCMAAAFVLGGFKSTIWFWMLITIFVTVALIGFVLQLLFYWEILYDPWDD